MNIVDKALKSDGFFFYQVVTDSLSVKVTFEQSPEGSKGVNHRDTGGGEHYKRRNSKYKDPKVQQTIPVGWIEIRKGEKSKKMRLKR